MDHKFQVQVDIPYIVVQEQSSEEIVVCFDTCKWGSLYEVSVADKADQYAFFMLFCWYRTRKR